MSKKISEMSLDELRDHALAQEERLAAATQRESELNDQITELNNVNQALQTRNNTLFMKLEQQTAGTDPAPAEPAKIESCEDIGAKIARGEI